MKRNIAIAVVLAGLLLTIQFGKLFAGGLWLQVVSDSVHVPIFGVIAVCVLLLTPARWSWPQRFLVSTAIIVLLALLSELAQVPIDHRSASVKDFLSDLLGGIGVLCVAIAFLARDSMFSGHRIGLIVLGITLTAAPLVPLAKVSIAYIERARILPELTRFDSRFAEMLYSTQNAELIHIQDELSGTASIEILSGEGAWPGIAFGEIWPDWRAYSDLIIELENPEQSALFINIRIHDLMHRDHREFADRFNRRVLLYPGRHRIAIMLSDIRDAPAGRQMRMSQIDALMLFVAKEDAGRRFVLHDLRLAGSREKVTQIDGSPDPVDQLNRKLANE